MTFTQYIYISINRSLFYEQMSSVIEIILLVYEIRHERLTLTNYRIQMWTRRNSGKQSDPSFPKIQINGKKIILKEQDEIISDERKVAEIFMDYFNNVTKTIDVPKYDPPDKAYVDINDPILRAIDKYKSHLSVRSIKLLSKNKPEFKFKHFLSLGSQKCDQLLEK